MHLFDENRAYFGLGLFRLFMLNPIALKILLYQIMNLFEKRVSSAAVARYCFLCGKNRRCLLLYVTRRVHGPWYRADTRGL